jgi:hypothetical protein
MTADTAPFGIAAIIVKMGRADGYHAIAHTVIPNILWRITPFRHWQWLEFPWKRQRIPRRFHSI